MSHSVYRSILDRKQKGKKSFVVLIDPDSYPSETFDRTLEQLQRFPPDYIFIGGSLLSRNSMAACLEAIGQKTSVPLLLFPGDAFQVEEQADAVLFLSLISGRNPDYLIGQQVKAAPIIREMDIEPISTGYMLVDGGRNTTAHYMSQSFPIPREKPEIASNTALAGEMLGMKCLYLDAGSGAQEPVPSGMIRAVRNRISVPLIVGGGITGSKQAVSAVEAGADIVVVGNAIQRDPSLVEEMSLAIRTSEKAV